MRGAAGVIIILSYVVIVATLGWWGLVAAVAHASILLLTVPRR